MSDFLLQKSLKLLQDSKPIQKSKQLKLQKLKRKKKFLHVKQSKEELQKILENLDKLNKLSHEDATNISEKVLSKVQNIGYNISEETKDKPTVFTDQDFEEFEKEYFAS